MNRLPHGDESADKIRKQLLPLVKWSRDYGLSNEDELWATGVEDFVKLPMEHKKAILDLMRVTGSRNKDNRRMRQHKKANIKS